MPDVRSGNTAKGWRSLLTGINTARHRAVLKRLLIGMFLFSLFSLVYIGLFPSVVRLNLDISPASTTYRWLYAVWGAGAFFGAISVGTFLSRVDRKVLIVRGFIGFGDRARRLLAARGIRRSRSRSGSSSGSSTS